jgi:hypothetical protein
MLQARPSSLGSISSVIGRGWSVELTLTVRTLAYGDGASRSCVGWGVIRVGLGELEQLVRKSNGSACALFIQVLQWRCLNQACGGESRKKNSFGKHFWC